MKCSKISAGYYKGIYKEISFEIVKVENQNNWYWICGKEGGEDWFSKKKIALASVKEYIDEFTK